MQYFGNCDVTFFKVEKIRFILKILKFSFKNSNEERPFFTFEKSGNLFTNEKKEEILLQLITFEKEGISLQNEKKSKSNKILLPG